MAKGGITKRSVDALAPSAAVAFLWDDELKGFGMKVTPARAITYVYQYRMRGREAETQRYSMGKHGSPWTPTTARAEAKRLGVLVSQGTDPVDDNKRRRRESVELSFKAFGARFHAACEGNGWRGLVEPSLRLHAVPVLGTKALPAITRSDVLAVIDAMPPEQQARA